MPKNDLLTIARTAKNDEFYTTYDTIATEMEHYRDQFYGKTVYCNCDDYRWSNFVRYFKDNFVPLGLARLIATHYSQDGVAYRYDLTLDNGTLMENVVPLKGDGDFRSDECVSILGEADMVVTNPPFSLFKEFVPLMDSHDLKYIVLGNINALGVNSIFELVMAKRLWLGASIHNGDIRFRVPSDYTIRTQYADQRSDGWYIKVSGIRWWTNVDYPLRRKYHAHLTKFYNPIEYPFYDNNMEIINVDSTPNIPRDWDGMMGVPITFFDKYNPDQFEILGVDKDFTSDGKRGKLTEKERYTRLIIRRVK